MNDKLTITDPIKLGPRLQTIASFVPPGTNLGDIGTDHAYLPVHLAQKGIIAKAIGVDIHQGPYESAQQTVSSYGLNDKIDIRLGNGLVPLEKGEVDTLVIAGMGGFTILEILGSNPQVIKGVTTLILQPQGAEARVRSELLSQGWKLLDECLINEDNRIYTVICLSRSQDLSKEDIERKIDKLVCILQEFIPSIEELNYSNNLNNPNNPNSSEPNLERYRPPYDRLEDKTKASNISVNRLRKIIWQLGPLILTKKEKLLANILDEAIVNQHKVIREMSKTDREDVRIQADGLKQEVNIMEGIRTWLFQ